MNAPIAKYSVRLAKHRTSISIEPIFWDLLKEVAAAKNLSRQQLIEVIDQQRLQTGGAVANLSSALRVYILLYYVNGRADFAQDQKQL
jgi:predicted DNA-binding ribbon-helix-helix protein